MAEARAWIDTADYARELLADNQRGGCFICDLVRAAEGRHVIFRNDVCVAFLPRYPTLRGRVLLAPVEHRTQVVGDFTEDEYIAIQRHVYRLGRAISAAFPTERLYILSLGSNEGVAHVHWHIAPLPPGVPFAEQQFHALDIANGYFALEPDELAEIVQRIANALG